VEIQTEESDLTTMPNLYLVSNPLKVVRSSGTIITAEVSLGYDVPHDQVEELLIQAARDTELEEPFMQILTLGDFSINYRAAGLLRDVRHLLSTRSRLHANMLNRLHGAGIEIVSPTFMNTRQLSPREQVISQPSGSRRSRSATTEKGAPEDIVFDKAAEAASLEKLRELEQSTAKEIESIKGRRARLEDPVGRKELDSRLELLKTRLQRLADLIAKREEDAD
jgi:hypothetical protein